jgi:hypothetical protein
MQVCVPTRSCVWGHTLACMPCVCVCPHAHVCVSMCRYVCVEGGGNLDMYVCGCVLLRFLPLCRLEQINLSHLKPQEQNMAVVVVMVEKK